MSKAKREHANALRGIQNTSTISLSLSEKAMLDSKMKRNSFHSAISQESFYTVANPSYAAHPPFMSSSTGHAASTGHYRAESPESMYTASITSAYPHRYRYDDDQRSISPAPSAVYAHNGHVRMAYQDASLPMGPPLSAVPARMLSPSRSLRSFPTVSPPMSRSASPSNDSHESQNVHHGHWHVDAAREQMRVPTPPIRALSPILPMPVYPDRYRTPAMSFQNSIPVALQPSGGLNGNLRPMNSRRTPPALTVAIAPRSPPATPIPQDISEADLEQVSWGHRGNMRDQEQQQDAYGGIYK